ncbi:MAG TPA: phospholipid carrier-dependent glycosyltransferase [Vulgatibacter sp.]|nr:phospholipid carrier-dependent glycosyltransferase [Vulgatibacter sp.]
MPWIDDFLLSWAVPALALTTLPIVRRWEGSSPLPASTRLAASFALLLAWWQVGGMVLGFSGTLSAGAVAAWLALGAAPGIVLAARDPALRPAIRRPILDAPLAALAVVALAYLLVSTVPPWYRDSLVYHLALPREFAMAGGYVRPDDNVFASFPLGWESILAMLHALGPGPDRYPPFNPRLLGAWTTLATAVASTGLARTLGASEWMARWAGVLFLLVPTVFEFGTSTYVEPWLLLLGTLALDGALRAARGEQRALLPAAVSAGFAASVKYPGVALCVFLALLLLASGLRRTEEEGRRALRWALLFALVAGAVASPFYLRNLFERGNPFFPVAFDVFGGEGWDSWRDIAYGITLSNYGMGRSAVDFLLLPFRLFTAREMRTGFEGSLGPVVGAGVGALLLLWRRAATGTERRDLGLAGAFVALWSIFWALSVQQVRFYLVAIPPLLALLVLGIDRLPNRLRSIAAATAILGAAAWLNPAAAQLGRRQDVAGWLQGQRSEEAILTRLLPDSYPPMRELERWVPEDGKVWLVWMRGYTYYLRRPYRLDSVFEAYRLEALLDETADSGEAPTRLRADGITHLLVHGRFFLRDGNADLRPGRTDRIRAAFDGLVRRGDLRLVQSWGEVELYEVRGPAEAPPSARID